MVEPATWPGALGKQRRAELHHGGRRRPGYVRSTGLGLGGRYTRAQAATYCIAVSNTADLSSSTLSWYAYQYHLTPVLGTNAAGNPYWPDWPKLGVWADAYYVSFNLEDPLHQYRNIGVLVCAFDRTNMLLNATPRAMQCFSNPSPTSGDCPSFVPGSQPHPRRCGRHYCSSGRAARVLCQHSEPGAQQ